jgi:hypothetical protein
MGGGLSRKAMDEYKNPWEGRQGRRIRLFEVGEGRAVSQTNAEICP